MQLDGTDRDAADIRTYLPQLRDLLPDRAARPETGGHRKVSGSPAPWNDPVAHLLMDVHAGARELADTLDLALGNARQARGSSDAGTTRALDRVAVDVRRLREAAAGPRWSSTAEVLAEAAAARLAGWALRSRELLDQLRPGEEPWSRVPGGLACPNPTPLGECGRPLWLAPGWQHDPAPPAYCRRCADEHGQPCAWPFGAWLMVVTGSAA